MKKLLGIVVLGLLWCNVGVASELGGIREIGTDQKCLELFEEKNIFEEKMLPGFKRDRGIFVTYIGCSKYYDDWGWWNSTNFDLDKAHTKAYHGCVKEQMPKYNITGCHLFSINDVIVWGKDPAFVAKLEKDIKTRLAKINSERKKAGLGCIKGDCINGQGTETFANGYTYTGEFKNGKQNGQGTEKYANGYTYTGEFKNGKRTGQGTETFANGYTYTGEFKNGIRTGQGTEKYANGYTYTGEFKNGKRTGQGTETLVKKQLENVWTQRDNRTTTAVGIPWVYLGTNHTSNFWNGDKKYIFSANNPSTLKELTFKKKKNISNITKGEKRSDIVNNRGKKKLFRSFSFIAEYEDNITVEFFIEYANDTEDFEKAKKDASYFSNMYGQMPHFLKIYNKKIYVHEARGKDDGVWWATGRATSREFHINRSRCGYRLSKISYSMCAVTMIHELAHVIHKNTGVISSSKWLKAKKLDKKKYCSKYAKTNNLEDFAESLVCWIFVRHKGHAIKTGDLIKIKKFTRNRLKFFDEINFNVYPL